jgi:uncharacterized membrane protein YbhN (UPF0104 family)
VATEGWAGVKDAIPSDSRPGPDAPVVPPPRPKGWLRRLVRWLPLVVVVGGCIIAAKDVDTHALGESLLAVRLWPLGLAVLFTCLGVIARATYWWVLVRSVARVSLREMVAYGFACSATNVLPMRAGDALRVWLVTSRHGVPVAMSGAVIAIEKISDVTSLLLLISPLPWLISNLPPAVATSLRVLPCVVVAALVAIVVASRHASRWKILSGFTVVRRPGVVAAGMACVFLAWVCDVCCILSVLVAVHIAPALEKALLVILSVNGAIALPVTPGQVGAHELGSILALAAVGVAEARAIPFAVLYHAAQLVPVLLVGLGIARQLSRERAGIA